MPGIFISYRRQDSQDFTGRIYDHLADALGERNVFRDIDDIPVGQDFRTVLERETGNCDILLVIIGPKWIGITDQNGKRRLDDPNDFVRIEVEAGLKRKDRLVIPVLVNNASMPQPGELPESLKELAFRNAALVRQDPDFHHDMEKLIRQIKLSQSAGLPVQKYLSSKPGLGLAMFIAAALILAGFAWLFKTAFSPQTNSATDTPIVSVSTGNTNTPVASPTAGLPFTLAPGTRIEALYGFSVYQDASQDSKIITRVVAASTGIVIDQNKDRTWTKIQLDGGKGGWALSDDVTQNTKLATPAPPRAVATITLGQGYGVRTDEWQLYFTDPRTTPDSNDKSGIDFRLADAISRAKTIDMAIYEMSSQPVTDALLEAHQRGKKVRIVSDDEAGLNAQGTTLTQLKNAGIPVVPDNRSALMHDKFVILDGTSVWTGSWNLTEGSTFEQNNNVLILTSPEVVVAFEEQFNKMFEQNLFSPKTPKTSRNIFDDHGINIEVYFSPQDSIQDRYLTYVSSAQKSIRMMAFTFTDSDLGSAVRNAFERGASVQVLSESRGASTESSQVRTLFCAGLSGLDIRLDGNPSFMHNKVIVIDGEVVITGSLNFTSNALQSNNENVVIVHDPLLAQAYNEEFERLWSIANIPNKADMACQ